PDDCCVNWLHSRASCSCALSLGNASIGLIVQDPLSEPASPRGSVTFVTSFPIARWRLASPPAKSMGSSSIHTPSGDRYVRPQASKIPESPAFCKPPQL